MEKKLNKKKIVILILIILLIVLITVSAILYKKNITVRTFLDEYFFRKNITENTLPKITTENSYAYAFNDTIVCLEKNELTFYTKSANKLSSVDLEISDPIFEACGKFLCVAEKNGSKFYLLSNRNILWQKDIEGSISNISINKNGYVAVAIADTTYKNICKVYDTDSKELFTSYLSKSYVIASSISEDNKFLALAEANFSGITLQSSIKIISIEQALSNSTNTIQYSVSAPIDDFIINIEYCGNNLVCLYDSHIDIIKDNSVTEVSNLKDSNILFADINNKIIQVQKRSTGMLSSEFELQFIDISSLEKKTYSLNKEPKSIEAFGNVVAVNFGTEVLFINDSGWLIKNYTSYQEIQSVVVSNNVAGIIYKDKIEFLGL